MTSADTRRVMVRSAFTVLLALCTATASAQSLNDLAKQTEDQRKGQKPAKTYTSKDLPGPARVDSTLGTFVINDDNYYDCSQAEIDLVKARSNAELDHYLLKWELETSRDPFGMIDPYSSDKRVLGLIQKNRLTPRDFVFCRVALDRARNDLGESKAQRVTMSKPRLATLDWLEKHPGALTQSSLLAGELRFLEIYRSGRVGK